MRHRDVANMAAILCLTSDANAHSNQCKKIIFIGKSSAFKTLLTSVILPLATVSLSTVHSLLWHTINVNDHVQQNKI